MKLVIQVPCFNEEHTLPETLQDLPRQVEGFDSVEWLIVDDGSTDGTVAVAERMGVDHIVRLSHNQGLAIAFMTGIEACLRAGADVIVNTDGDNQYAASCIPRLVQPILEKRAQIVVGERPVASIAHFSPAKRKLQSLGSWVVRAVSGASIKDAPSGFRAIHKDAAARLYVFNRYTYTLETIIQASRLGIPVASVPVEVNDPTRESRLMKSTAQYIFKSAIVITRIAIIYKPLRFFAGIAVLLALPGMLAIVRFLYLFLQGQGDGHVQSLVIGTALVGSGVFAFLAGILADLIAANRVLLADIRARMLRANIDIEK
ncbi:glycosyltransferase family 2 protein [Oceanomicrobium pacificus]|uniref:Glycosyltransferase n=1 Tax=Oceanomicrobium pacificus TaxID=2692916 RepID=A0A6B0TPN7_9RHOB|nr:glycosyltransferase family 2 protein [Oceanomicrobium pacificus]MXU63818.1 glycosyltransferase [Oceanomicrobium pacificus]